MAVPGRWRELAGRLALAVVAPALFLGLLEAGAWLAGVEPVADHPDFQARDRIENCRWNPDHLASRCTAAAPDGSGVKRIFVFGGSSVAYAPERGSMARELDAQLRRAHPGEYRVRNLGRSCKDSFFVRGCVERVVEAEPDLIVIYSGHNDFGGYCTSRPRLRMVVARHPWLLDLRRALARTRFYALLARGATQELEPPPALERGDPDWDVAASIDIVLESYLENLEAVVELAGRRGIPVILVTVVSNVAEFPVPRAGWDAALERAAAGDAAQWLRRYARGIELARQGRFAESLVAFEASRDVFYPSQRAPSALNEGLRALSRAHEHVHLVDFEAELDRLGAREAIGCRFFGNPTYCDGVHPNTRTNRIIGRALFEQVEALRLGAGPD